MTDGMIEKVAMEIYASTWIPASGNAKMEDIEKARIQARAAIKAMREPTEQMIFKARKEQQDKALPLQKIPGPTLNRIAWQAMIDAALDEKE